MSEIRHLICLACVCHMASTKEIITFIVTVSSGKGTVGMAVT